MSNFNIQSFNSYSFKKQNILPVIAEMIKEGEAIIAATKIATITVTVSVLAICLFSRCFSNSRTNNTKIKALEIAKQKEIELAQQEEIEKAKKIAEEALLKQKLLQEKCEEIKAIDDSNKEILNGLHIRDYYIPLDYPKEAETLGFSTKASPIATELLKPAFDAATEEKIVKIRNKIALAIESKGTLPLPHLFFSGVAGVGKSMLIAHLCKANGTGYIKIPTGILESKILNGEELKTLQAIVEVAKTSKTPVYIMLDDGEGLLSHSALSVKISNSDREVDIPWEQEEDRINSNDVNNQRRKGLIQEIINLAKEPNRKISFAFTTNRPSDVADIFKDIASTVEILPPGKTERMKILIQGLSGKFGKDSEIIKYFSKERLSNLGDKTEGFTGRNLIMMADVLFSSTINDPTSISDEHIDKAIETIENSVESLRKKKA